MGFETKGLTAADRQTIANKADEPRIVTYPSTQNPTVYTLLPENNTEYRYDVVAGLDIYFPGTVLLPADAEPATDIPEMPENFAAMIHFSTGETPPNISYDDIKLKGDDVTVETDANGKYYLFDPQPNTRYDIGIEYDGLYVKGFVSGTELV